MHLFQKFLESMSKRNKTFNLREGSFPIQMDLVFDEIEIKEIGRLKDLINAEIKISIISKDLFRCEGRLNTTFIDNDFTSFQSSVVQYAIAAMDSCSFGNPPQNNTSSAGSPHQNILLQDFYDQCSGEVILTWNSYINFAPGLSHYEIYYRKY